MEDVFKGRMNLKASVLLQNKIDGLMFEKDTVLQLVV